MPHMDMWHICCDGLEMITLANAMAKTVFKVTSLVMTQDKAIKAE